MLGANKSPATLFFLIIIMLSVVWTGCFVNVEPGSDTSGKRGTGTNGELQPNTQQPGPDYIVPFETTYVDIPAELARFAASEGEEIPIYLKIGDLFVLDTYPNAPYMENGRLMVHAKLPKDLMGGQYHYDEERKMATIDLCGYRFEFEADSTVAFVNGKRIELDVKPIIDWFFLHIPLDILLANTDIEWSWTERDEGPRYLWIKDSRVQQGEHFDRFREAKYRRIINAEALELISYKLTLGHLDNPSNRILMIKAKNASGANIPKGETELMPLVGYYGGGYGTEVMFLSDPPYIETGPKEPEFPLVKDGEIIVRTRNVGGTSAFIVSPGMWVRKK